MEKRFIQKISLLRPSKHVYGDRNGSEENTKVKFVIPLLEYLGYSLVENLYFEVLGIDILAKANDKNLLIVECKGWTEFLEYHQNQYLDYMYKMKTPYVLATSGQQTALYIGLLNPMDLAKTEPFIKFSFQDLLTPKGVATLSELKRLVGLEAALGGFKALHLEIEGILGEKLAASEKQFLELSNNYKKPLTVHRITDKDFLEQANDQPKDIKDAIIYLKNELMTLVESLENLNLQYKSTELSLGYLDYSSPRPKRIGLFGISPAKARLGFGIDGWERLGIDQELLKDIRRFPKDIINIENAQNLSELLRKSLESLNP